MPPRQHRHTLCLRTRAISALSPPPYQHCLQQSTSLTPRTLPKPSTPSPTTPTTPLPRHLHPASTAGRDPPGRGCSVRDPSELPKGNEVKGARRRLDFGGEAAPSAKLDSSYFGAKGSPSATLYASNNCLSAQQLRPPALSSSPHFSRRRASSFRKKNPTDSRT